MARSWPLMGACQRGQDNYLSRQPLSNTAQKIYLGEYLPHVNVLSKVNGEWNLDSTNIRGRSLAELVWNRIGPWLSVTQKVQFLKNTDWQVLAESKFQVVRCLPRERIFADSKIGGCLSKSRCNGRGWNQLLFRGGGGTVGSSRPKNSRGGPGLDPNLTPNKNAQKQFRSFKEQVGYQHGYLIHFID